MGEGQYVHWRAVALRAALAGTGAWVSRAACAGMASDLFFAERGESTRAARQVCAGCPVQPECLDYALRANEKWGLWGGASERQRRRMRHTMRQEAS